MDAFIHYKPPSTKVTFHHQKQYHVFLSFRGPDVRKTLVDHLFDSLTAAGVHVFLDSERLGKGEIIDPSLQKAIRDSDIHIPIFSKRYADSPWCLEELSQMCHCKSLIIPLFYDVEPSHVRYPDSEKSPYAEAFSKLSDKGQLIDGEFIPRYKAEKIEEWKKALKDVSDRSGWSLKETTSGFEGKLVKRIVLDVLDTLNKVPLDVGRHVVGLEQRIDNVMELLQIGSNDRVAAVGIWGIGGMGKTTLAKALFNQIHSQFDAASFVFDVRENAKKDKGLKILQQQMLTDLLKDQNICVSSIAQGKVLMKERLRSKRALVVLDDVDDKKQIEYLGEDCLGAGSRIIITTREKHTLNVTGVTDDRTYTMERLEHREAVQLFCWHAFMRMSPDVGYEGLSVQVIEACQGHPLSLEIIGSHLYDKKHRRSFWMEALNMVSNSRYTEIHGRLKISYDTLGDREREIFLDIACFFIGTDVENALVFWKSSKWNAGTAIENLKLKMLVKISDDNKFQMHDVIRDMGRAIVAAESPDNPSSRSRLWEPNDVVKVITAKRGTDKIQCLFVSDTRRDLAAKDGDKEAYRAKRGEIQLDLKSMPNLRLLWLESVRLQITGECEECCSNLKWLFLNDCDLHHLPSMWNLQDLIIFHAEGGTIRRLWDENSIRKNIPSKLEVIALRQCDQLETLPKLWNYRSLTSLGLFHLRNSAITDSVNLVISDSIKRLSSLKRLNLSECVNCITTIPHSIESLRALNVLILRECKMLAAIPDSIGSLQSLTRLDLGGCSSLMAIPDSIGSLQALVVLVLSGCSSLVAIPDSVGSLHALTALYLEGCSSLVAIPDSIGSLQALTRLCLSGCSSLVGIPDSIGFLQAATRLDLSDCSTLVAIPDSIGSLPALKELDSEGCSSLVAIPGSIQSLQALMTLVLSGCSSLLAIPDSIGSIQALTGLYLEGCSSLAAIPDAIGSLQTLKKLYLSGCSSLVAIPDSIGFLQALTKLVLSGCSSLVAIPGSIGSLQALKGLYLENCSRLVAIPDSVGSLPALTRLVLAGCSTLVAIPDSIGSLEALKRLDLEGCSNLVAIPDSIGSLQALKGLNLSRCSSLVAIPDSIGSLQALMVLVLSGCSSLVAIPDSIGSLQALTTLYLSGCSNLVAIPDSIGSLHALTRLILSGCSSLVGIPNSIGSLQALKVLDMEGCSRLVAIPNSIGSLDALMRLVLAGCSSLMGIPNFIGSLQELKGLDLEGCSSLVGIPDSIGSLQALRALYLEGCSSLVAIPNSIVSLQALTGLYLSSCSSLVAIPNSIGSLHSLTQLILSGCSSLVGIPNSIGALKAITRLDLRGCSTLVRIPDSIGSLQALKGLDLSGCSSLVEIPNSIGSLQALMVLVLSGCSSIATIPDSIMSLQQLMLLDLSGCLSLVTIPDSIGSLQALVRLDLSGCSSLVMIPDSIGSLQALMLLDFSGCSNLLVIPDSIRSLQALM